MKNSLLVMTTILTWGSGSAQAGPITFLTALPVATSQAVVRAQYFLFRATDDPTPAERDLMVNAVPVAIAVGATPRLALFGIVPIVDKSIELTTPTGRIRRDTIGLGDIVTFARYTVYAVDAEESTFGIAPFGGIKMPTGDSDESDALGVVPRPLQPGSGSWDGLGGLAVTYQTKQWELDADTGIRKNTEADGFRFGDEFFADLSLQYRVWPRQLGGKATSGSMAGEQLNRATAFPAFWFGWRGYFPSTAVWQRPDARAVNVCASGPTGANAGHE